MSEPAHASEIAAGTVVGETYEVIRQLGRGGMGAVWEAHHKRLPGKKVAIKVLHGEVAADRESLVRFRREAEIASRLGHPNIVEVHDFNSLPSGAPYLVLEFLEGESLDARIARGPLSSEETLSIVRQIGSALRAAHREGVVHRDLKPQNVFMALSGDAGEVAKVLDFGISKIRGSQTVKTQESSMLGTPQYMAPEQATGKHDEVDARTDVFALGAMVYEMLCGAPAFPGQTIPEVVFKVVYQDPDPLAEKVKGLSEDLAGAVHKALAKDRNERFPDVDSFVEALTGSPLATGRRPPASPAAAPPMDPLAATVDSGKGEAMLGTEETMHSGNSPVPGTEETMHSGSAPLAAEKAVAQTAAPAPAPGPAPEDAPPRPAAAVETEHIRAAPRSTAKTAILAVAFAAAGAGAAVALIAKPWASGEDARAVASAETGESGGDAPETDEVVAAGGDEDGPARDEVDDPGEPEPLGDDDEAKTEPADEGERSDDAPVQGAADDGASREAAERATARDDRPQRESAREAEPEERLPPELASELEAASSALNAGDFDQAIRLVERVERRRATVRGYAIKARAYCAKYDLANARASWRNLPPRAQRRVARFCEQFDILL